MFLPSISRLLLLLALVLTGCAPKQNPSRAPAASTDRAVTVVWGTGTAEPDVLEWFTKLADEQLLRLSEVFPRTPVHHFFVHVHASRSSMPEALIANLHPDSPGFAMLGTHQIHLVLGEMRRLGSSPQGVIAHEIVHELLDQYVAPHGRGMPRWFHEGLAQYLAGDTYLDAREDDLVWRVAGDGLLPFYRLHDSFPGDTSDLRLAYAQSFSYVAFLVRTYGLSELLAVARATDGVTTFERALVGRLDRSTLQLEDAWRSYILHGSGAPWRVALDSCFSLCLVAALPLLVLALMRRLRNEARVAQHLATVELAAQSAGGLDAELDSEAEGTTHADDEFDADEPDPADEPGVPDARPRSHDDNVD